MSGKRIKGVMYYSPRVYEVLIRLAHLGVYEVRLNTIRELVSGSHVLELGCGTAAMQGIVAPSEYVGLDLNDRFVSYAKGKRRNAVHDNVFNFRDYLSADGSTVLLVDVLHHIPDHDRLLRELTESGDVKSIVICEPYNLPDNFLHASTFLNRVFDSDGINGIVDWYDREGLEGFLRGHGASEIIEIRNALLTRIDVNCVQYSEEKDGD